MEAVPKDIIFSLLYRFVCTAKVAISDEAKELLRKIILQAACSRFESV
ncbi:hypothetical protein PIN17_A0892 [Prevotella intermedia 17]|nr:hypothetical protein PIN17_A0892 [Prevotella intermedia 17]